MPEDDRVPVPEQKPSRWKSLLVGAVELATWWLRQGPQRPSVKKVLGIGAIVGIPTLTAGPLVAGALMAVGTAVLLTRLADNASHAVERLATVPVR